MVQLSDGEREEKEEEEGEEVPGLRIEDERHTMEDAK